jgi:hypothetical protein
VTYHSGNREPKTQPSPGEFNTSNPPLDAVAACYRVNSAGLLDWFKQRAGDIRPASTVLRAFYQSQGHGGHRIAPCSTRWITTACGLSATGRSCSTV